jgi:hypothetical protein
MNRDRAPNPSIERTATGKPASAAHVKRWARRIRRTEMLDERKEVWAAGNLYEPYVGRWSGLVARDLHRESLATETHASANGSRSR